MSTNNHPTYFPRRANSRVNNLAFASEVDITGLCRIELGAPAAAVAAGIMSAVDVAAIITKGGTIVPTFNADAVMGPYGRNLTLVLSGAGTPTVTVRGRDYLGQPISENFVATGATPVVGKKAFKSVDNITTSVGVAATTLNLGYGTTLGLPYAMVKIDTELLNNVIATAGTFAPAVLTAQTISSGDPRGTYIPNSAPDGARDFVLGGYALNGQLHGLAHFTS
jgi:hypothetical protein